MAGGRGKSPRRHAAPVASRGDSGVAARGVGAAASGIERPGGSLDSGLVAWLGLGLILAATVILYIPALGTQFFADDFLFLDQVRGRSLWESLRAPDPLSNFFRPVSRQLYFWAVAGLTHESPVAFRIGNLITLLVCVVLLHRLVRRLAGERAALIGAAFFALNYAADVPVRWACGSQELLAVAGALAAILLHVSGRRVAAGVAMLFAALSKEVVLLTPLIAIVADHAPNERWSTTARRAWPLAGAVLVWGAVFLSMPHRRAAQATEVEFDLVRSPISAVVHLLQVVGGIEWRIGGFGALPRAVPPFVPLAAAVGAVALAWNAGSASCAPAESRRRNAQAQRAHVLRTGAVWILLATAPVIAVALLWSAYYYLFAMCGVALVLGVLLARARAWVTCAVLAVLAWGSTSARDLDEFGVGRDPWTPASHINRAYIERSNRVTARYLASLHRAVPKFPPGSTVFFGGLMGNVAFQRADGPLLRWAYRDSSLKSHYLTAFSSETAQPGPLYFFVGSGDTLSQQVGSSDKIYQWVAFGMIVSDQAKGARDALDVALRRVPGDREAAYWIAWVNLGLGDRAAAMPYLAAAGYATAGLGGTPPGEREAVLAQVAAGDTAGAVARMRDATRARPLDASAHALLADLLLIRDHQDPDAAIEAYAARVLTPEEPYGWRRWAMIQASTDRTLEALSSFNRYFKLGGQTAAADTEAHQYADAIRNSIPRGSVDPEVMPE